MDRTTLQQLDELRVRDAEALLAASQWEAAYYLLGYSIECALKACIAQQFRLHQVPEKKLVNSFYAHNLEELLSIAGLKSAKDACCAADAQFEAKWNTVQAWTEATRYDVGVLETKAREMFEAVTHATSGILPWMKTQW